MSNPTWLESQEPLRKVGEPEPVSYGAELDSETERRSKLVFWAAKIATISLCVLMFITSLMGFAAIEGVESLGRIFVALYMLFFSILLVTFECCQVRHVETLDFMFRRNFGFLYDAKGKAFFIIFIAFLSFGLEEPKTLSIATGKPTPCLTTCRPPVGTLSRTHTAHHTNLHLLEFL